jgi:hypothetical protein
LLEYVRANVDLDACGHLLHPDLLEIYSEMLAERGWWERSWNPVAREFDLLTTGPPTMPNHDKTVAKTDCVNMNCPSRRGSSLTAYPDLRHCLSIFYDSHTRLQLENKYAMRARGIPSPDEWDAVALTFATHASRSVPSKSARTGLDLRHNDPVCAALSQGKIVGRTAFRI